MKRFTVASLLCFAAIAIPFASARSAAPVTPIVKNVPGGVVMTGRDTGAPVASPSPATRNVPMTLPGIAVVMTGTDTGSGQSPVTPSRALPITLAAPGVMMTGQDGGPVGVPRPPIIRIPPSPSPTPTRGIKP